VEERRRLVGVSEIAELLGVSKQRASVLASRKGFPDPLERVIPVDADLQGALLEFFEQRRAQRTFTAEESWQEFKDRAFVLPDQPRLWRRTAVEKWAAEHGRGLR
jgi:hypothetical protein